MPIIQTNLSQSDPLSFSEVTSAFADIETSGSMRGFLDEYNKSGTDTISLSEFAKTRVLKINITSDVSDQNLYNLFVASTEHSGWNNLDPFFISFTIDPNCVVYSTTSTTPALTIGNIPSAVKVFITNNGNIIGGPGQGGSSGTSGGGSGGNGVNGGIAIDFTGFTGSGRLTGASKIQGGAGGGGGGNGGANGSHTGQETPNVNPNSPNQQGATLFRDLRVVTPAGQYGSSNPVDDYQYRYARSLYYNNSILVSHWTGWTTYHSGTPGTAPPAPAITASVVNSQLASALSNPHQNYGLSTYWYNYDDSNYPGVNGNWVRVARVKTFNTNGGAGGAGGNGVIYNGTPLTGAVGAVATGNTAAKDSSALGGATSGVNGGNGGYFSYNSGTDTYTYTAAVNSSTGGTAGSQGIAIHNKPVGVTQS